MRKTRFTGIFQRCDKHRGQRCRRHRFCFYVELAPGGDGRRRQVSRGGYQSAAEAAAARAKVVEAARADRWPTHPSMTTEQWLRAWYATKTKAGTLRPATARCYRQQLEDYLIRYLGST